MLPGICNQTSRIRKCSERFPELKGKKGSRLAPLMILTGFLICGRSNALRSARTNALSWQIVLPGLSESFATGLPLHSTNLITIFRVLPGISQVRRVPIPKLNCTREEKWRYSSTALRKSRLSEKPEFYSVDQFPAFHNVQWLFTPFNRVARVMTQALIPTSELDTEITQESIHSDAVG